MGNRITRTVLFAASALLSMSAFGAGAARFGTLRNADWVVTNAWQAVSNRTHDLIIDMGQEASLPPNWLNVSNAAMHADAELSTNVYTKAETDERIIELSPPASLITDGTNTIDAAGNVFTNSFLYTDWAFSQAGFTFEQPIFDDGLWYCAFENDFASGSTMVPAPENAIYLHIINSDYGVDCIAERASTNYVPILAGMLALTNDIPIPISVVAPSTNAITGQAADAKSTGIALYTGFTDWEFSGVPEGFHVVEGFPLFIESLNQWELSVLDPQGNHYFPHAGNSIYDTELTFVDVDDDVFTIVATRSAVVPKRTSQLTNDGSNGVPFAVVSQIPDKAIVTNESGSVEGGFSVQGSIIIGDGDHASLTVYGATTNYGPLVVNEFYGGDAVIVVNGTNIVDEITKKVSANVLSGQTYDFSRNYDIIKATADIIKLLGGTVTNNPTGGN